MNPHKVEWTNEKVKEFWRVNHANFSRRRYSQQVGPALSRIVNRHVPAGSVILDYGCGNGDLLKVLDVARYSLIGTDYEQPLGFQPLGELGDLATKGGVRFVAAEQLEKLNGQVDAVLLIEVVEHLEDAVLGDVLGRIGEVLRPGGTLMVTTPNREDLAYNTVNCPDCGCMFHRVQHVRSWTSASLADRLRQQGFAAKSLLETDLGRMQRSLPSRLIRTALDKYDRRTEPHLVGLFQR
jgi:SAM-dependent methyltransferase